jgi:TetR/AcrR family transcriptional repressor of nem operon
MVDMETKELLLSEAERLVRKRGFDAMSFADLASAANIRKASVHYHFATKADLAAMLVSGYRKSVQSELDRLSETHITSSGKLGAFLQFYLDALDQGEAVCLCVAMSASKDSFDKTTLGELEAFQDMAINWLSDIFDKNDGSILNVQNASQEAAALFALVEGAQLIARAHSDTQKFIEATALFAARLKKD